MKLITLLCTCCLLLTSPVRAEVKDSVSVSDEFALSFRMTSARIDSTYHNNKEQLKAIRTRLRQLLNDPCVKLDSLRINATASPEGPYRTNLALSKARGETMKAYLLERFPTLNDFPIHISPKSENWEGLLQAITTDTAVPARQQVLDLLNNPTLSTYRKKQQLKQIAGGKTDQYLVRHILPPLRNSSVYIRWYVTLLPTQTSATCPETPVCPDTCTPAVITLPTVREELVREEPSRQKAFPFNLRTNLLNWATLSPNAGIEIPFAHRWSALFEAGWTHWNWRDGERRFRFRSLWPEVRYHFAANSAKAHLKTRFWYVGLYLSEGQYNYHLSGSDGRQGHFLGAGLSGGYLLPLSQRLSLDLGLSAGYTADRYHTYRYQIDPSAQAQRDTRLRTAHGNHFGLTKARVTLVWKFNQ